MFSLFLGTTKIYNKNKCFKDKWLLSKVCWKRFLFKKRKYHRLQFLFHFHHYFYDANLLARQLLLRKLHGFHWIHHCCAQIPAPKTGILVKTHTSLSCTKAIWAICEKVKGIQYLKLLYLVESTLFHLIMISQSTLCNTFDMTEYDFVWLNYNHITRYYQHLFIKYIMLKKAASTKYFEVLRKNVKY